MKKMTIVGLVFIGIVFAGALGFAQDFQTSDLEGTWQLYMFETDPVAGSSYYAYGSFTADEAGNVTAGTYIPPVGPPINVAGGTLSLDDDGILSGSIDAEGGIKINFPSGKLNADKNILTYVANPSTGAMDFGLAIKDGGSFSTSDLEGTWHVYMIETNPVAGSYWLYGSFTVDDSGEVTGGTYNAPGDVTVNVIGGTVSLDGNGVMSGTVDAEGGLTGTFPSGKLDADKNIIAFIGNDTNGSMDLGVAVKAGLPQSSEGTGGGGGDGGGGGSCFISTMNK